MPLLSPLIWDDYLDIPQNIPHFHRELQLLRKWLAARRLREATLL